MWTLADIGGVRQGAADLVWKERGYEFLRRARSFKTRTLSHLWTLKCLHIVQSHYIIPINHLTSRTPSNQNNLLIIAQAGALISTKIIIYGFEACFIFIQCRSNTVISRQHCAVCWAVCRLLKFQDMCMMMSNDPGQCVFCPRSFCTYLHMLWSGGGSFDDEDSELEGRDDDTQRPHFLRHFWETDPYLFILS